MIDHIETTDWVGPWSEDRRAHYWKAMVCDPDRKILEERIFVTADWAESCPERERWIESWGPTPVREVGRRTFTVVSR